MRASSIRFLKTSMSQVRSGEGSPQHSRSRKTLVAKKDRLLLRWKKGLPGYQTRPAEACIQKVVESSNNESNIAKLFDSVLIPSKRLSLDAHWCFNKKMQNLPILGTLLFSRKKRNLQTYQASCQTTQ